MGNNDYERERRGTFESRMGASERNPTKRNRLHQIWQAEDSNVVRWYVQASSRHD